MTILLLRFGSTPAASSACDSSTFPRMPRTSVAKSQQDYPLRLSSTTVNEFRVSEVAIIISMPHTSPVRSKSGSARWNFCRSRYNPTLPEASACTPKDTQICRGPDRDGEILGLSKRYDYSIQTITLSTRP